MWHGFNSRPRRSFCAPIRRHFRELRRNAICPEFQTGRSGSPRAGCNARACDVAALAKPTWFHKFAQRQGTCLSGSESQEENSMKHAANLVFALGIVLAPGMAHAQDVWPSRPITFIVMGRLGHTSCACAMPGAVRSPARTPDFAMLHRVLPLGSRSPTSKFLAVARIYGTTLAWQAPPRRTRGRCRPARRLRDRRVGTLELRCARLTKMAENGEKKLCRGRLLKPCRMLRVKTRRSGPSAGPSIVRRGRAMLTMTEHCGLILPSLAAREGGRCSGRRAAIAGLVAALLIPLVRHPQPDTRVYVSYAPPLSWTIGGEGRPNLPRFQADVLLPTPILGCPRRFGTPEPFRGPTQQRVALFGDNVFQVGPVGRCECPRRERFDAALCRAWATCPGLTCSRNLDGSLAAHARRGPAGFATGTMAGLKIFSSTPSSRSARNGRFPGPRVTLATTAATSAYFGINAAQSAASVLRCSMPRVVCARSSRHPVSGPRTRHPSLS